jgi:hypothetical protein
MTEPQTAAILLIAAAALFTVGGILFTGRAIWKWPVGQTPIYLRWERGFVIVAVLGNVLGLVLLDDVLSQIEHSVFALIGMVLYLFGAVVVVVAEGSYLSNHEWVYPQVVIYVVLAFLAQAAFGVALIQTELVADWIGWATILWNLGWLLGLVLLSPREVYYPALHHAAPLVIGIAILLK